MNTQGMLGGCTSGAANAAVVPWGGYSDWYLPASDELRSLFDSPVLINGVGDQTCWTSTQYDNQPQYAFKGDAIPPTPKVSASLGVIPIRAF